ncbi:interleukin-20 receptor subunit alpha [Echeneis naucrates]|uniref:Interleukin-22 receptor subunit alpha-1-like n=1 Tax=Echeneis naucrates TaxID=173247 RepID=A0A665V9B2_ECHNA|nr:interleukin-22 receptor subunit alpha-1-like [Echeneis naucrates]
MWTLFMFLSLGLLHCTVSSSPPSPINIVFSSENLRNLVSWTPGNGTQEGTLFTVQYAIYGDSVKGSKGRRVNWRVVHHCTNIGQTWCDLSNETWDQEQGYYAKVRAVGRRESSKWSLTGRRFDPKSDTSFGPPLVSVEVEGRNAIITLKGPLRYQPSNHTPVIPMATLYPQMTYSLLIQNSHHNQIHDFPVVSSPYKYQLMQHSTEYCFSARARLVSMPILCKSSAWHCITTPKDPVSGQLQKVVSCIVVPCLCICIFALVGYFLHNYLMGKGQKKPHMLNQLSFHPAPLAFPPEKLNLILIGVTGDESPSSPCNTISGLGFPKQQITGPPPRYSTRRHDTTTEHDESSVEYDFVGIAPEIDREEEARMGWRDRGEDDNGRSVGAYSPQARSSFLQKAAHTCMQTQMQMHSQTYAHREVSTLSQAHAWTGLIGQIRGSLPSSKEAPKGEADKEKVGRECPSLFLNKNLQTGCIHIPLNVQTNEEGMEEEMDGTVTVKTNQKIDGSKEQGSGSERVFLISAYASQNVSNNVMSHNDQSDYLPCDYSALCVTTAHGAEEAENKEDQGTNIIDWDPETRKIMLPEIEMKLNKEGVLDGLMQGEEGSEDGMRGEEDRNTMRSELKLENVFVTQSSGDEAEALREMEGVGETDDILTKWDLVILLD